MISRSYVGYTESAKSSVKELYGKLRAGYVTCVTLPSQQCYPCPDPGGSTG
jgi:hypothetical protein